MFGFPWENWNPSVEFNKDAAERPHIDCGCVRNPQHDFWRPVEPRLDVSVDALVTETAGTEIDDLDARLILAFKQYVLWLQVAVDDVLYLQIT